MVVLIRLKKAQVGLKHLMCDENEQIKERDAEEVEVVKSLSSSEEGMGRLNENVGRDLGDQDIGR